MASAYVLPGSRRESEVFSITSSPRRVTREFSSPFGAAGLTTLVDLRKEEDDGTGPSRH